MKIALINPYFGKWPTWFPMYLLSCRHNPQIDWIIPTDCELPPTAPSNVHFIKTSLRELCEKASDVLNTTITQSRPYKVCDIRPAFGLIYQELLEGFDFWGHCDLDLVWGNIGKFVSEEVLRRSDVISARKERIAGHFTLYRNREDINNAFRLHPLWKKAMTSETSYYFDEVGMTEIWADKFSNKPQRTIVHWPEFLFNWPHPKPKEPGKLPFSLNRWVWSDGRVFQITDRGDRHEVMYLNFMHWKKTLKTCFIDYQNDPSEVYLSYSQFSEKKAILPTHLGPIGLVKIMPARFFGAEEPAKLIAK